MLLLPVFRDGHELIPDDFIQSLEQAHKAIEKGASDSTHAGTCQDSGDCSIKKGEEKGSFKENE